MNWFIFLTVAAGCMAIIGIEMLILWVTLLVEDRFGFKPAALTITVLTSVFIAAIFAFSGMKL